MLPTFVSPTNSLGSLILALYTIKLSLTEVQQLPKVTQTVMMALGFRPRRTSC